MITCTIHPAFGVLALLAFAFFAITLAFDAACVDVVAEIGRAAGAVKDGVIRAVGNLRNGVGRAVWAVRLARFDRRLRRDDAARRAALELEAAALEVLVDAQHDADVRHWEETRYRFSRPTRYEAEVEVTTFLFHDGSKATDWV